MSKALPEILEQEKGFELDLENNVTVKGRIDQINSLGRKDVEIVDYKTGTPRKDSEAKKVVQNLTAEALTRPGIAGTP